MKHERAYATPAELVEDRIDRIESLARMIVESAQAERGTGSWGAGGSLTHVAARLAELADFLDGSEDGAHDALETLELRALAGVGEWPAMTTHEGVAYRRTGKNGKRVEDGRPVAEYATDDDARLWLDVAGNVWPD